MVLLTSSMVAGVTTAAVVIGTLFAGRGGGLLHLRRATFHPDRGHTRRGDPHFLHRHARPIQASNWSRRARWRDSSQGANQADEADVSALKGAESNGSGVLSTSFTVPSTFKDADTTYGVCPPTQAQVDAGEVGCTLAVATVQGVSYGNVTLVYAGQPTPQTPVLTLSPASAGPGQGVTITGGGGLVG